MSTIFDNVDSFSIPQSEQPSQGSKFIVDEWFTQPTLNGKEIPKFTPKLGFNKIDIIPFQLGSDLMSKLDPKRTKGTISSDITLDVYFKVQLGNINRSMPSRTALGYGDDPFFYDPHAKRRMELFKEANKDKQHPAYKEACTLFSEGSKKLKARQLLLVMVYDDETNTRSLHYWSPSWHVLGKLLLSKQENLAKMGQKISYGNPVLGKSICFTGYTKSMGEGTYVAFDSIELADREKPYPEDIYTKMPKLDLCVKVYSYEEMLEMLSPEARPPVAGTIVKEEVVVVAPPKLEVPPVAEPVVSLDTAPTTEPVIVTAPIGETKPVAEVTSDKPLNLDDFSF